jgi:hypothetical protein
LGGVYRWTETLIVRDSRFLLAIVNTAQQELLPTLIITNTLYHTLIKMSSDFFNKLVSTEYIKELIFLHVFCLMMFGFLDTYLLKEGGGVGTGVQLLTNIMQLVYSGK